MAILFRSPGYIKSIRRLNLVIFGILIIYYCQSLWFLINFRMNMMEHGISSGGIFPAGEMFLQKRLNVVQVYLKFSKSSLPSWLPCQVLLERHTLPNWQRCQSIQNYRFFADHTEITLGLGC